MIFYHALDEQGHLHILGTQADARAINKRFTQVDIPTDKAGLQAELQRLYAYIDELKDKTATVVEPEKPVAITLDGEVIARFDTVAEAEDFLGTSATIDPDRLEAGDYGIDAPEEMVNPPVKVSQAPPPANDELPDEDEERFDARILEQQVDALGMLGAEALERFDGWSELTGISPAFARGVALLNVVCTDQHSIAKMFLRDRLKKRKRFGA
jgi:hypothetical protein